MRTFLNGKSPKMSVNLDAIQNLVDNVLVANYPFEVLSDPELPYLTLGAYIGGKLSVWEASNLLIWHQEIKDFPNSNLKIVSIFEKMLPLFNSEEQLALILRNLNFDQKKILRVGLFKLPVSQQVMRIMDLPEGSFFTRRGEFSLMAHRVLSEIRNGHPIFDQKPQLGDFSKKQIIKTEIEEGMRLRHIPMPGIDAKTTVGGKKLSHTEFSAHDRDHMDVLNRYSPMLVNALRESMSVLIKTARTSESIWKIGDFSFSGKANARNPNMALAGVLQEACSDSETQSIISHIRLNHERWQKDYQIFVDQVIAHL